MTKNNFQFLRFLFAILVVISHAYVLSGSTEENAGINKLTNGQLSFSQIGLSSFFVISGYFIFQSLQRSETLSRYYKNRFLRFFPGLVAVLILSLGFVAIKGIKNFGDLGDASYGVYIYSFPIQQTLVWFYKMNTYILMIYSVVLSIVFGFLSWHLIEKKMLDYKNQKIALVEKKL